MLLPRLMGDFFRVMESKPQVQSGFTCCFYFEFTSQLCALIDLMFIHETACRECPVFISLSKSSFTEDQMYVFV